MALLAVHKFESGRRPTDAVTLQVIQFFV